MEHHGTGGPLSVTEKEEKKKEKDWSYGILVVGFTPEICSPDFFMRFSQSNYKEIVTLGSEADKGAKKQTAQVYAALSIVICRNAAF